MACANIPTLLYSVNCCPAGRAVVDAAVHANPGRFEAIVLCDTKCDADSDDAKAKRFETIENIKNGGLRIFVDGFIKSVFSEATLKNSTKMVKKIGNVMFSNGQKTITASLRALAERTEMCTTLININIPTLIICGDLDALTPPKHSEYLQKNIKNAVFHLIENAGHLSNLEQSDKFNAILETFLAQKRHLVPTPLYGNEFVAIPRLFEK